MEIEIIKQDFTISKVLEIDTGILSSPFCFYARTDDEISLVCDTSRVPDNAADREDGWRAFRVKGVLDFSLTGILSAISGVLADCGIGIFAVSTYNTDYILIKKENFEKALSALSAKGYCRAAEG